MMPGTGLTDRDARLPSPALREAAARFGTPAYVIDMAAVAAAATRLETTFAQPWLRLFSMKANDLPAIISVLPDGRGDRPRQTLSGEPPDPTAIPSGCRFHPRCPRLASLPAGDSRADLCRGLPVPVLPARATQSAGECLAACHLVELSQSPVTEPGQPLSQGA